MESFNASSLNAIIKSVKDDPPGLVLHYPEVCEEQKEFVKQMIEQCLTDVKTSVSESVFDPLAEVLNIFGLRYNFNLNAMPTSFDMKLMILKKVSTQVSDILSMNELSEPYINTVTASLNVTSLNTTLEFAKNDSLLVLQYPFLTYEQTDYAKQMILQYVRHQNDREIIPEDLTDPLAEVLEVFSLQCLNDAHMKFVLKETRAIKEHKLQKIPDLIQNVSEDFARRIFLQIRYFIADTEEYLRFEEMTSLQEQFLLRWKIYAHSEIRNCFSEDIQGILCDIEELIRFTQRIFTVHTMFKKISATSRYLCLKKKWVKHTSNTVNRKKPVHLTPTTKVESESDEELNDSLHPMEKVETEITTQTFTNTTHKKVIETIQNDNQNMLSIKNAQNPETPIEKVKEQDAAKIIEELHTHNNENTGFADKLTANMPIEKVKSDVQNIQSIPTTEVKITIEENDITYLNNDTHTSKDNVQSCTELNKSIAKVPIEKVMTDSDSEVIEELQANKFEVTKAIKESSESNNNTLLISMPTERNNAEYYVYQEYIAVRNTTTSSVMFLKKNIRVLIDAINNIDGFSACLIIDSFKEFHTNPNKDILFFTNLKWEEMEFVLGWENVVRKDAVIKLFSDNAQIALKDLRCDVENSDFKVVMDSKTITHTNRTVTFKKVTCAKKISESPLVPEIKQTTATAFENTSFKNLSLISCKKTRVESFRCKSFLTKTKMLPHKWLVTTLNQILDFLKDDLQASFLISDISVAERAFLTKLQSTLKLQKVLDSYDEGIRRLLDEIHQTIYNNEHKYGVTYHVTKFKLHESRHFTYIKTPPNDIPTHESKGYNDNDFEDTVENEPIEKEPLKLEKEPLKVKKEPLKLENEPLKLEKEPLKVKKEPLKLEKEPLKVKKEPLKVEKEPLKLEKEHLKLEKEPLKVKKEPLKLEKEHLKLEKEHLKLEKEHLKLEKEPLKLEKEHLKLEKEPLKLEKEPFKLKKNSTETSNNKNIKIAVIEFTNSKIMSNEIDVTSNEGNKSHYIPKEKLRKHREYRSTSPNTSEAEIKLREGLNQPLVSDIGIRLMKKMGWKGGVLGAGSNGLVEPIAVNIDKRKRAGLGSDNHPPVQSNISRSYLQPDNYNDIDVVD